MRISRESVYAAMWARVSTAIHPVTFAAAFRTVNRRLKHWDDVPEPSQPALFMVQGSQNAQQTKGLDPKWLLPARLFVYDNCGAAPGAIPGQRINYLLDAIDDALKPNAVGYQTLGGLVHHCWLTGAEVYEGFAGMMDQSVAIVSVEILVPDASGPV